LGRLGKKNLRKSESLKEALHVYPVRIMTRCAAAELDFRIIPAVFNAPLEFLTGFTPIILVNALEDLQASNPRVPS